MTDKSFLLKGDDMGDQHPALAGYRAGSPWPGEDGGPTRRQQPHGPRGLGLAAGRTLRVAASRHEPMWTMAVVRDPGELFLFGHTLGDDTTAHLDRVDPETLATSRRSPDLPAGPFWPGGVAAHANGDLYATYGRWCHRLDADCQPVASRQLPRPRPYNSLLVLPDGHLVMKDFGGGRGDQALPPGEGSELVVLEPEGLEVVARLELPEGSIARLSARVADDGGAVVVVVGDTHLLQVRWDPAAPALVLDDHRPRYLTEPGQGFGWDAVVAAGSAWFLDDGEGTPGFAGCFHGVGVATAPLRLWRAPLAGDAGAALPPGAAVEVCGRPGGIVANPPVVDEERGVAVGYDSGNGVLAAWRFDPDPAAGVHEADLAWRVDQDQAGHMVLFPDTGELLSYDYDRARGLDQVVVREVASGEELARVDTESPLQHVVFPGVVGDGEVCTVSFSTVTRLVAD